MALVAALPPTAVCGDVGRGGHDELWSALRARRERGAAAQSLLVAAVRSAMGSVAGDDPRSVALIVSAGDHAQESLLEFVRALTAGGPGSLTREHATLIVPSVLNEEAGRAAGLAGMSLTMVGSEGASASGLLWAIDAIRSGEVRAVLAAELVDRGAPLAVCVPLVAARDPGGWNLDWCAAPAGAGDEAVSALREIALVCGRPPDGRRVVRARLGALHLEFVLQAGNG